MKGKEERAEQSRAGSNNPLIPNKQKPKQNE
jgi:hypothetical protein